jgi:hypothetical protein
MNYLVDVVLPILEQPRLRQLGMHHVALSWMPVDLKWTSAMGAAGTNAGLAPLLPRGVASAGSGGEGGAGPGMAGGRFPGMPGAPGSGGAGMPGPGGRAMGMGGPGMAGGSSGMSGGGGYPGMSGRGMGGYGDYPGGPGGNANDPAVKNLVKRTRTDFLIQFVWQPPTPETPSESWDDIAKKLKEAEADPKNKGAVQVTETELSTLSEAKSKERLDAMAAQAAAEQQKAATAGTGTGAATTPPAGGPTTAPPATGGAPAVVDPGAPATKPAAPPK